MIWITTTLGIFGLCWVVLGYVILVSSVNDSPTWKEMASPGSLGLLGFIVCYFFFPQDQQDSSGHSIRDTIIISIGILLPWIYIVLSLKEELRAGSRLLKVRNFHRQQRNFLWNSLTCIVVAIFYTVDAIHQFQSSYGIFNLSIATIPLMSWSWSFCLLLKGINGLKLGQSTISYQLSTLRWRRISSYRWAYGEEIKLILGFRPRFPLFPNYWSITIPAAKQESVDRVLVDRLPGKAETLESERYVVEP